MVKHPSPKSWSWVRRVRRPHGGASRLALSLTMFKPWALGFRWTVLARARTRRPSICSLQELVRAARGSRHTRPVCYAGLHPSRSGEDEHGFCCAWRTGPRAGDIGIERARALRKRLPVGPVRQWDGHQRKRECVPWPADDVGPTHRCSGRECGRRLRRELDRGSRELGRWR
jgi:hypothetical protein